MKVFVKFLLKVLRIAVLIYGILFAVFYFDLDGKFLYYIWEPFSERHYARLARNDATKTPYGPTEKLSPREYTEIL